MSKFFSSNDDILNKLVENSFKSIDEGLYNISNNIDFFMMHLV
jgi:hypothetical protein